MFHNIGFSFCICFPLDSLTQSVPQRKFSQLKLNCMSDQRITITKKTLRSRLCVQLIKKHLLKVKKKKKSKPLSKIISKSLLWIYSFSTKDISFLFCAMLPWKAHLLHLKNVIFTFQIINELTIY